MLEFADDEVVSIKELVELYSVCGWIRSAADPDQLARAVDRSTYVVTARDDGALVGLTRCLSDDVSVMYLQEVVVHPDRDQLAVASILVQQCISRHHHVRQIVALTDQTELPATFYEATGFKDTQQLETFNLKTFVRFDGIDEL